MKIQKYISTIVCLALLTIGITLEVSKLLSNCSNYPFNSYWSEGGRIFNAFQIYAPLISNVHFSWPWLDPARSLMDGLVLLVPGTRIWMWRAWIGTLFLITAFSTSFLVVKKALLASERIKKSRNNHEVRYIGWLLIAWGGIFLLQGPIYYHLLFGIIPVLLFYKREHNWRTSILIAIMGIWTGLARVNWFLMPAVVAITLYLLEESRSTTSLFRYLQWPIWWGMLNVITSIPTYFVSLYVSGKPSILANSMNYGFFRLKLWPNIGNSLGLIPGILLTVAPVVIIILLYFWICRKRINWVRVALLAFLLSILGAGSTLVSLRAGGGYNFHNYDTLLVVLLIIGIYSGLGTVSLDSITADQKTILFDVRVICIMFCLPVIFLVKKLPYQTGYSDSSNNILTIRDINQIIEDKASSATDIVLFIDYRQLVVYRLVSSVQIYIPYEKIELMEMAMANNKRYFDEFQAKIRNQEFTLIVSEPLYDRIKPPFKDPYWYENNVWAEDVASPILQFYEPIYLNRDSAVAIYVPKK
jgi:MFS family permease